MTSNVGAQNIRDRKALGFSSGNPQREKEYEEIKDIMTSELKKTFRPEFLNRIDEIVMFNPLSREVQIKIVDKLLNDLRNRLEKNNINVEFTDGVRKYVIDNSYNTTYGARPIKRFIQKNIETEIAKKIISSEVQPTKSYTIDYQGKLIVREN